MVYGRMNQLAFDLERGVHREAGRTGTYIYHTPAIRCSCNDDSGQPLPSCRVCGGDGFFHPLNKEQKVRAILTNAVTQREFIMGPGLLEREDILITFVNPVIYPATQDRIRFDRVDLKHLPVPAESFILERGTGLYDELPQRVARLISVVRSDPRRGLTTVYRPGIDVIAEGNNLNWQAKQVPPVAGATMPPTGTQYAVTYHGDYDFLVIENLAPRHIGSVGMRPRALVRRRHVDQRNIERENVTGPLGFNPNLY